jgi:uncharacterized sporulation protein YeaH/YhbH (DUF444 family)
VPDENQAGASSLWVEYDEIQGQERNFAMTRVSQAQEIYSVFCDLFRKEKVT